MGHILQAENPFAVTRIHVCTIGRYNSLGNATNNIGATTSTAAWPANNLAIYIPVSIPVPFIVARFMIPNGSNLTGTVDVGIYSAAGTLLLSTGNSARANASAVQYLGVTDTLFQAGTYYLGLVASSTTGTYLEATWANATRVLINGPLQEALGSATLPNPMTPAAYTQTFVPQFGFTQSDTV